MPQGHCTLPADDAGRVLDRLAGLEQIISPAEIQQALAFTGRSIRAAVGDPRGRVVGGTGDGGLDGFADPPSLQERPAAAQGRRVAPSLQSLHRPSAVGRGARCGSLFNQVIRPLARPETPGAFYKELRLMGVDGTIFDVPDSEANAAVFARPSAGPRGEGAFPQVRKLSLVELGTHVEVGLVVRSSAHGEQSMIGGLFRHLTPEMLLLWDRGFFSYELWREMTTRGVKVLARVKSRMILPLDPPLGRRLVPWPRSTRTPTTGRRTATGLWCA